MGHNVLGKTGLKISKLGFGGIAIPAMFIQESYYSRYNLQDWAVARHKGTAVKASAGVDSKNSGL